MKKYIAFLCALLLFVSFASVASGAIKGEGPSGSSLVSRLHRLIPKAFLNTPKVATVEAVDPETMSLMVGGIQGVLGLYVDRHIYIRSDLTDYNRDLVLVHEYGHFVWFNEVGFREQQAYARLWRSEKFAPDEYRSVAVEEGFAEAFAFYVCSEYVDRHKDEDVFLRDLQRRIEAWATGNRNNRIGRRRLSNHPKLTLKDGVLSGNGKISTFGDVADVASGQDNGIGCTGYRCVDNPYAPYCSLPIEYWDLLITTAKQLGIKNYKPDFQEVTIAYNGHQVEHFNADKGPGGTPSANDRLVDTCPTSHKRLRCQTDSIVTIYIPVGRIVPPEKRC